MQLRGVGMIKLIVAEDEPLMNKFIANSIEWKQIGIEMCGTFFNGKAALDYIEQNGVDVVLCDIEMPIMDGLELIEHVAPSYPDIKFIFLSNYSDFYTVKSAFQFGAVDYILKADFSHKTLCDTLSKMYKKSNKSEKLSSNNNIRHRQFLRGDFWNGKIPSDTLNVAVAKLVNYESVVKLQWDSERENIKYGLSNCIEEILEPFEKYDFFFNEYDEIIFLLWDGDSNKSYTEYDKLFCRIIEIFNCHFGLDAICSVYDIDDSRPAKEQYNTIKDILKYTLVFGKNRLISVNEVINYRDEFKLIENKTYVKELIRKLELDELYAFLENVASLKISFDYIDAQKEFYTFVISEIKNMFEDFMLDELKQRISDIDLSSSSASEINKSIKELTDLFMNLVVSSDIAVMHIRNYVYENYSEDITLKQLAEKFNFDYGGLSRRFQRVTGMSFPNFLNEIRLNEAMRIIKITDHKISTVAEMVGYNNYESFSRNFKKKFNRLPNEIRKG